MIGIQPEQPRNQLPVRSGLTHAVSAPAPEVMRPAVYGGLSEEHIEYLTLLRRHRVAIFAICGFCIVTALIYTICAPKTYKAATVLDITGVNQDFMNIREVNPSAGPSTDDAYLETELRILQNETIANRVVAAIAPTVPSGLATTDDEKEAIVRRMVSGIKAKQEGASSLIQITLTGPDPDLVARTTNEVATQYIDEEENARLSEAAATSKFLNQQLNESKAALQSSENALQQYARASGIVITNDTQESVASEHLREIQQGLAQAEVDRANREAMMDIARNSSSDALPQVFDDPTIRQDRDQLRDLKVQLANLGTTMTPANYKVERIQAEIQDLEAQMDRHRAMIVNRLSLDDREAVRRQSILQDEYNRQLTVVTDDGGKQVRYNMLRHEVDINRQIYQSMVQKVNEAAVMAALKAPSARIVSTASPTDLPSSPKLSESLLLSGLLSIISSLLYILIAERRNRSVRNPGESARYLARPELAVIPHVRPLTRIGRARSLRPGGREAEPTHPMLDHWRSNDGAILAEAYRSAGTSILFSTKGALGSRVLLVTSPHPQCGKTMTIGNLAISLAEGGRRVLLIDGDMRRPALAQLFSVPNTKGLSDVLDPVHPADPRSLIQATTFNGVQILTSGEPKTNTTTLLHSNRLRETLDSLQREYDFVLVDAPPLLGIADARILSRCTDGVILICRAERTSIDELEEARRLLTEDGTNLLGTILNGYNLQRERPDLYRTYLKYAGQRPA
ncbi:MAG TPA: polysaccharide biosynthesis tyrosine autokinase [Acidobacteriaceae bacterium]|jgi:capsular exopolysaccharide synthesis family protein|nr:polysaccharide biosynthesis tyrosine autokinase [Acidobacteriaceae bacterium]